MNHGLKPAHFEAILEVLRKNPRVQKAILFGSRAMGTFTKESDIDLCLVGDDLTLSDQADLLAKLEELPVPQSVDLVLEKKIEAPAFLAHVREHGKTVLERKREGLGMGDEKRILRILGVLDDKIKLNREMNTTLKAMARAIGVQLAELQQLVWNNECETHTLARIRDDLLPRLLSGELPVTRVEHSGEGATKATSHKGKQP